MLEPGGDAKVSISSSILKEESYLLNLQLIILIYFKN